MVDFAKLVLAADSTDLEKVQGELGRVAAKGAVAEKATNKFGKSARNMNKSLIDSKKLLLGVASGMAAYKALSFMTGGMTQARSFGKSISEVTTLLAGTAAETKLLREESLRLSAAYGGTAKAQAEAFYQAISAGAGSAAQAAKLLETANKLAIGGVTDVTTSVNILTTAMNSYAQSGLTAADAADTLFLGVKAGKTNIPELAASLGTVTGVAASVGISFQEVVAATAALSTQMPSTAQSVTGLKAIISSVIRPTKEAAKAALDLGLAFDSDAIKEKGLVKFLDDVIDATGGSVEKLGQLFTGTEALTPMLLLAGSAGDKLAQSMIEMEFRAGLSTEAQNKMAADLDNRLGKSLTKITNQSIKYGQVLLRGVVPALEIFANNISSIIITATTAATVLGVNFVASAVLATGSISAMTAALVVNRAALMRTGWGLAAVGLGVVVARLVEARDATRQFQSAADQSTAAMGDQIDQVNLLAAATGTGNIVTLSAAEAQLKEAQNIREKTKALIAEREEALLGSKKYQTLLQNIKRAREQLNATSINNKDAYEGAQQRLKDYVREQIIITTSINSGKRSLKDQEVLIQKIQAAIGNSKNGLVSYNGELVSGVDLLTRQSDRTKIVFDRTLDLVGALKSANSYASQLVQNISGAPAAILTLSERADVIKAKIAAVSGGYNKITADAAGYRKELELRYGLAAAADGAETQYITGLINRQVQEYQSVQKLNEAYDKATSSKQNSTKALTDEQRQVEQLMEAHKNALPPFEKFNNEVSRLEALKKHGLSDEAMALAVQKLRDELAASIPMLQDFSDFIGDTVVNGKADFKSLADSFKSMLSRMISDAAKNKIMLHFGSHMTNFASGIQKGIGAVFGGGFKGLFSGGLASSLGALVPVLGAVSAAVSFFSTKTKTLDSGLRLTANGAGLVAEEFSKLQKSRFWGMSKKTSTNYNAYGGSSELQNAYSSLHNNITGMAADLGVGAAAFNDFKYKMNLSLKGLSEDQQKAKIAEEFVKMGDALASLSGVDTVAELTSIRNSLLAANSSFADLGLALYDVSVLGAQAAQNLIDQFESLDAFTQSTSYYFQNFYSEEERLAANTKSLTEQLAALGYSLPTTTAQFRMLVDGMREMGDDEGLASLLKIAPLFKDIADAQAQYLDNLVGDAESSLKEAEDAVQGA